MPMETATESSHRNIVNQMNKMMDQMQKGFFSFCPSETWTPSVNLYETETHYLVCVDLAGVQKEKIDLQVHEGRLTLRGIRSVPTTGIEKDRRTRVHLMEIDHGSFVREVELPSNSSSEHIAAQYRDGLLWVEVPKTDAANR